MGVSHRKDGVQSGLTHCDTTAFRATLQLGHPPL